MISLLPFIVWRYPCWWRAGLVTKSKYSVIKIQVQSVWKQLKTVHYYFHSKFRGDVFGVFGVFIAADTITDAHLESPYLCSASTQSHTSNNSCCLSFYHRLFQIAKKNAKDLRIWKNTRPRTSTQTRKRSNNSRAVVKQVSLTGFACYFSHNWD